ncbi:helix-turn-helix domain-containing protein [Geomonas anaerohicana]|uniref:Response regulator n=1 Tax=Geomonas anaerohicana TaxID=2798583 RepID=A0ABS0YGD1_9BACT|nr:helix-turn-helix transcriptional regulator [Geomonas anaerohicana]MBJ6751391.1 response regulator [Geomonas anaerohicana]
MTIEEAFGIVIRRLRRERNLSQDKLSMSSCLDRKFISNIEGGKQQPSLVSIFALASALNTSASSIIYETEFILKINTPDRLRNEGSKIDWISSMEIMMNKINNSYQGSETILIVDDEKQLREMLSDFLASYGYKVITAEDGQDAIEKYTENGPIHLVVLDVVMPRKDGISCFKEIKKVNPKAKAVFMSGYRPDHLQAKEDFHLIQKPFSPVEMIKAIRSALESDSEQTTEL